VALADAVREELRDTDFAARYGGDEFVVLLPQTNESQGAQFAERLRRRLIEVSRDAGLRVRGSIGVAAVSADELDSPDAAEDLLRRATKRSTGRSDPGGTASRSRTSSTEEACHPIPVT